MAPAAQHRGAAGGRTARLLRRMRWPITVMAALLLIAVLIPRLTSGSGSADSAGTRPWFDPAIPVEVRVNMLLARMSLDEKVRLLYGVEPPPGSGAVGYVPGIMRLGVPPLLLSDGPLGLRDSVRSTTRRPATAFPATVSLAATFNPAIARTYGEALGREARARGVGVLYGPAMNIVRVPIGGRNFEYFSEDPYLTGALASTYVQGVQSQHVAAQVKHFLLNNQEGDRHIASSNVDERTMREIYLPPWKTVVQQGGAWSVMCGNNPVNAVYVCENRRVLGDVLEGEWGFDGVVGSDYAATHSAVQSVTAGLDQSFTLRHWGAFYRNLPQLVRTGKVARATVDERVRRVLRMMYRIELFTASRDTPAIDRSEHAAVARRTAQEGTVLLRNDANLLPLQAGSLRSIAIVGPYAKAAAAGGGSSRVVPFATVSPVQGITNRAGATVKVTTDDGTDPQRAAANARAADVAVVVVGDTAREGTDRPNMDLPGKQNALISAVAAANPHTVVVLQTGGPVTMPWLPAVSTLVETWYPGQEGGNALAAVLFGDTDPSGRLPVTFPMNTGQSPSMGKPRYPAGLAGYEYSERLDVGYRGFDNRGLTPLFPFGYGLSYTAFSYAGLKLTAVSGGGRRDLQVTFAVTNTGSRAGVAVPQVYVGFPPQAQEPPRQLKAFERLELAAGESRTVRLTLDQHAFEYWATSGWREAAGAYQISVGSSSRNLTLVGDVRR